MNIFPNAWLKKGWLNAWRRMEYGTLYFVTPEGESMIFTGRQPGPSAHLVLHDWQVLRRILSRGDIGLGEDYIAGRWDTDSIEVLLTLFLMNIEPLDAYAHGTRLSRLGFTIYNRFVKRNSRKGSRNNISAHYDVGNDFYKLWLDESMTYSSAIYADGVTDLNAAQQAKYARILDKIGTPPKTILEIGCGWGGFAMAAVARGHRLTGVTISQAQYRIATERVDGRADIRLQDYRDVTGQFDAIVSIEMFEAVGEAYWPDYFQALHDRLKPGGTAVIQTITIRDELFADYRQRSDFIRHYVFPGGMLPSAARFREEAAKAGLVCREVYAFGQDYARTLRAWLERFEAQREAILKLGYDEAFIRNWRFYISICAASFALGRTNVVKIELAHA